MRNNDTIVFCVGDVYLKIGTTSWPYRVHVGWTTGHMRVYTSEPKKVSASGMLRRVYSYMQIRIITFKRRTVRFTPEMVFVPLSRRPHLYVKQMMILLTFLLFDIMRMVSSSYLSHSALIQR
jgi:hypothetical protein